MLKNAVLRRKKPRHRRGFSGLYLFYSLLMVRAVGLEPTRLSTTEPKSVQSTDSSMPAYLIFCAGDEIKNLH